MRVRRREGKVRVLYRVGAVVLHRKRYTSGWAVAVIEASTYALLKSLLVPQSPITKDLATLLNTLKDHFSPKPSVIAERFKFHSRSQKEGESSPT